MRTIPAALAASLLAAQAAAFAAPLTGVVTDRAGRPVAGALVGDFLRSGPFTRTDAAGRYTLEMPGEKRVVGAWAGGCALSGPRWIDARDRADTADFTLLPAGPEVLGGARPRVTREEGGTRVAWTLPEATVSQVEVRWKTQPAAWRIEMTNTVTNGDGASPHPEPRTYYRNGVDAANDNGNGFHDAAGTVAVMKSAPVTGVTELAVIASGDAMPESVTASSPAPVTMDDAVAALRIGAGLQDRPGDPNAILRWNAWNPEAANDPTLDMRDAIALLDPREVKPMRVLVINYEPIVASEGGKLLRQVTGWNDPHPNTDQHVRDMQLCSHGYLRVQRLPEIEAREYSLIRSRRDGTPFQYTEETFLKAFRTGSWLNGDWGCDYNDIIQRYDLVRRVDCGDVDEVWLQSYVGMAMWETTMAGPNAYWCNSSPVPSPAGSVNGTNGTRLFVMTAFNYEREPDVMIHDWGHRTESIVGEKVYGSWNMNNDAAPPVTTWDRFTRIAKYFPGKASVGYCHYPANAVKDYDYANPTLVSSDADDWYNYPAFTGARQMVNRDTWALPRSLPTGTPDYQRNYLIWMFSHMPHIPGRAPDGRLSNWWKYVADMNAQPESR